VPEVEEPLAGGKLNAVVRIGDTVRRPAGPWTPTIHALLRHVRDNGFDLCPEPIGFDDHGREILSYVPGRTVGWALPWPDWVWDEELLASMARATARYHQAAAGFRPDGVVPWQYDAGALGPDEVVCHDDLAPYNMVFADRSLGCVIDWDLARPGTVESELAFVAWQWIPLHHPDVTRLFGWRSPPDYARRLRVVLDAYDRYGVTGGSGAVDRSRFVEAIIRRVALNRDRMARRAADGIPGYVELVHEGHVAAMDRTIQFIGDVADGLQAQID
jgi:hypothetical protein